MGVPIVVSLLLVIYILFFMSNKRMSVCLYYLEIRKIYYRLLHNKNIFCAFFLCFSIFYYFYKNNTNLVFFIDVTTLFIVIDFYSLAKIRGLIDHIKNNIHKDEDQLNYLIIKMINKSLTSHMAPLFFYMVGGAPVILLYSFVQKNIHMPQFKKIYDWILYIPTRLYWGIIILGYAIYSQGGPIHKKLLNFKERNLVPALNGNWLESLVSGIFEIQLCITGIKGEKIIVGASFKDPSIDNCFAIFLLLSLTPYLLLLGAYI